MAGFALGARIKNPADQQQLTSSSECNNWSSQIYGQYVLDQKGCQKNLTMIASFRP